MQQSEIKKGNIRIAYKKNPEYIIDGYCNGKVYHEKFIYIDNEKINIEEYESAATPKITTMPEKGYMEIAERGARKVIKGNCNGKIYQNRYYYVGDSRIDMYCEFKYILKSEIKEEIKEEKIETQNILDLQDIEIICENKNLQNNMNLQKIKLIRKLKENNNKKENLLKDLESIKSTLLKDLEKDLKLQFSGMELESIWKNYMQELIMENLKTFNCNAFWTLLKNETNSLLVLQKYINEEL